VILVLVSIPGASVAENNSIPNWPAPTAWSAISWFGSGRTALTDVSNMLPFTAIAPCRVADTRSGSGFSSGYGPPSMAGGASRSFTISGQCGIPSGAAAVSFNFTVWNTTGYGDFNIYPTGGTRPTVSTLNWGPGVLALANAAVVPLGSGGQITVVNESSGIVDIFFDVNGYYAAAPASSGFFNVNTTGSYAAALYTSGANDALHTECTTANTCWAIHAFAQAAGTGYSGYFSGAQGLTSTVSQANAVAVQGTSTAGSGGRFISSLGSGFTGGVVGISGSVLDNQYSYAGVRGIGTNFGILGVSDFLGAGGFQVNASTGVTESGSYLGYSTSMGLYTVGTTGASGVKSFIEPHPTDATKVIRYVALEGGEAGTYFRGKARFVDGRAVIAVPEDFRLVTDEEGLTVQITPIGGRASVSVTTANLNEIVVDSSRDVEFYYHVNGVRQTFKDFRPMDDVNIYYMPNSPTAVMPGSYSPAQRQRLIANGTYNADGTVNMTTADRVGWTRTWQAREERAKAEARKAMAEQVAPHHD
jgi:hypothetical protein